MSIESRISLTSAMPKFPGLPYKLEPLNIMAQHNLQCQGSSNFLSIPKLTVISKP